MKNEKPIYELEERTYQFAKRIRTWLKGIPKNLALNEDSKQLIRSSGSVGANYIEANESLSKKDFVYRLRICKKEAKESAYWIKLIIETNEIPDIGEGKALHKESVELKKIFSAIENKSNKR